MPTVERARELGAEMLALGDVATGDDARGRIARALDDGTALAIFRRMVEAQGGDPRVADDPIMILPRARHRTPVLAPTSAVVSGMRSRDLGVACVLLGAGRRKVTDRVDPAAGIELMAHLGDRVERGQPLAFLDHGDLPAAEVARAAELTTGAFDLGGVAPAPSSRILEVIR
jgi:pyrimidine-nucleoside phosphorylase